jgi:hypothetical protein
MGIFRLILCLNFSLVLAQSPPKETIRQRFAPLPGFESEKTEKGSFGEYLTQLPLKKIGSTVRYFDGSIKTKPEVYYAVVDLPIGKKDLHQCADAVMRLRAEYLFYTKKYEKIHFNFLSDGKPRFFKTYAKGKTDYATFWNYMEYIFQYANTASLKKELKKVKQIEEIQIGDVFIVSGNPYGHAEIIVDLARNPKTGQKIFLLAQSYMPAQELQILKNNENPGLSPWFEAKEGSLVTPEWTFESSDLYRFSEP